MSSTRPFHSATSWLVSGAALALVACAADSDSGVSTMEARLEAVCVEDPGEVPAGGWICGEERVVECTSHAGATVAHIHVVLGDQGAGGESETLACEATDLSPGAAGPFPVGVHTITVTATTAEGDSPQDVCSSTLIVQDTTPPKVTPKTVELWPPNHKMRTITPLDCVEVEDVCDPDVRVVFLWASSDEPDDANGDGKTAPDIADLGCDGVSLRAERQGGGDGRVYTLGWRATDASGNAVDGTCEVIVPHDQGKKGAAVGGDLVYTLTAPVCD
ncbi:MAG: hypothetical protein AMXMBFR64_48200 [Myxococcales bacterium]